jgi:hypothetical protein
MELYFSLVIQLVASIPFEDWVDWKAVGKVTFPVTLSASVMAVYHIGGS